MADELSRLMARWAVQLGSNGGAIPGIRAYVYNCPDLMVRICTDSSIFSGKLIGIAERSR